MRHNTFSKTRFYSREDTQRIKDDLEKAVTIPVNIEIEAEHRVYDMSEIREILEKSQRLAVQSCGCKTKNNNCDAPRDVCLSINYYADEVLEKGLYDSKEIDLEDALNVLTRSHEAGLVHMAYTMKGKDQPFLICSCCPCCCHTLGSLVRNGIYTEILTSRYIAKDDIDRCTNCGDCLDRCVFQARWKDKEKLVYDSSKCFGCGLCISTCQSGAISLITRNSFT
ncbi:MAG: ATP-binding protein [Candidatus Thorarchaeota archaeon]|jgi:ferredoxin